MIIFAPVIFFRLRWMAKIRYFKNTLPHCPLIANFTECKMYLLSLPYGFPRNNTQNAKWKPWSVKAGSSFFDPFWRSFIAEVSERPHYRIRWLLWASRITDPRTALQKAIKHIYYIFPTFLSFSGHSVKVGVDVYKASCNKFRLSFPQKVSITAGMRLK